MVGLSIVLSQFSRRFPFAVGLQKYVSLAYFSGPATMELPMNKAMRNMYLLLPLLVATFWLIHWAATGEMTFLSELRFSEEAVLRLPFHLPRLIMDELVVTLHAYVWKRWGDHPSAVMSSIWWLFGLAIGPGFWLGIVAVDILRLYLSYSFKKWRATHNQQQPHD